MIKQIATHRTHRHFQPKELPAATIKDLLTAATRASNTGNMQLYSIITTTASEIRNQLAPCHFNQPAATEAPAIFTFCADIRRFSRWCELRKTTPQYDNFVWFLSAMTDATLASQNLSLEAAAHDLGICYLGTTLYNAPEISDILQLPSGVIPIMAVACGYPSDPNIPLTDRLPLEAVTHQDVYHDPTDAEIENFWTQRENSEETQELKQQNALPTLAHIFTERRYRGDDNRHFSKKYFDELTRKGFFNHEFNQ